MSENNIVELNRKRVFCAYKSVFDKESTIKKESCNPQKVERDRKRLKTICIDLPVLIQKNGLLTTLAYLNSKENSKENEESIEKYLYKEIEKWLFNEVLEIKEDKPSDILSYFIGTKEKDKMPYIENKIHVLTKETMEFAIWIKRNAEGMIDNKPVTEDVSISENGHII